MHYALEHLRDDGKAYYDGGMDDEGNRAHRDQYLLHRISKWHDNGTDTGIPASEEHPPTLNIICVDTIAGPCVAFPDILSERQEFDFFFLKPRSEWPEVFMEMAKRYRKRRK